ncbi:MAG: hypothetical protein OXG72_10085, partial [Acidobacteria bacterium]|nr:hypothetical protein [Acidobacteriota bacterium]
MVLGGTSAFTSADDTDTEVSQKFVQFPLASLRGSLAPTQLVPPDQASNNAVNAAGDVTVASNGSVALVGLTAALPDWFLFEIDARSGSITSNPHRWESYAVPKARIGAASDPLVIQVSGVAGNRVSLELSGGSNANVTARAYGSQAIMRFFSLTPSAPGRQSGEGFGDEGVAAWEAERTFARDAIAEHANRLWLSLQDDNLGNEPADLFGSLSPWWVPLDNRDASAIDAALGNVPLTSDPSVHGWLGHVVEGDNIVPGSIERPSGHALPDVDQFDYDAADADALPAAVLTPLAFDPWPEHVHIEIKASVSSSGIAPDLVLDLRDAQGAIVSSRATVETDGVYRYHRLQIIDPATDAGPVSLTLESVVTREGVQGGSGTYSLDFRDVLGFRGTSPVARLIASIAESIIAPPEAEEEDMGITQAEAIALINQLVPPAQRIPALAGHGGAITRAADDASAIHLVQPGTIADDVTAGWAQPGQAPPAGLDDVRIVQHGARTAFARPTQNWHWSIENRLTGNNQFDRTQIELAIVQTDSSLPSQADVTAWWEALFGGGTAKVRLASDTNGAGVDAVADRPVRLPSGSANYWNTVIRLSAGVTIPGNVQLNVTSSSLPVEFSHLAADTDIAADTLDFTALTVEQVGRVARIALPGSGALLPVFPGSGQRDGKIVAFVGDTVDWRGTYDFAAAAA